MRRVAVLLLLLLVVLPASCLSPGSGVPMRRPGEFPTPPFVDLHLADGSWPRR